jgi:hypothetical protein
MIILLLLFQKGQNKNICNKYPVITTNEVLIIKEIKNELSIEYYKQTTHSFAYAFIVFLIAAVKHV